MTCARGWFGGAVLLASSLLFVGEPMAAKQLLPSFGGSAAVWLTCLVFFQSVLLGGYGYAHLLTRGPARRWHRVVHGTLLAAGAICAVAWALGGVRIEAAEGHPVVRIFAALSLRIGVPFLVLGSTSPLLQVWYVRAMGSPVPYRLFALSNFASLLALLLYPSVIEPRFSLAAQRWMWCAGVLLFAVVSGILLWRTPAEGMVERAVEEGETARPRNRLLWFLLPMGASMQLSAVTGHLTTNVAAMPLLWVLPLAVYLLSFIVAFELPRLFHRGLVSRLLMVMLASLGYVLSKTDVSLPISVAVVFFLLELFAACLFCHAETFALRPVRTSETTMFYLSIAAGGVAGSFLVGIAAPLVFRANYDLAISFLVTAALVLVIVWRDGWAQRLLWLTGSGLLVFLVFGLRAAYYHHALLATRSFYGSLRVTERVSSVGDPMRVLLNGTIEHGTQIFSLALMGTPTTYYAADSGVGLALEGCCGARARKIGVVGLGVGTLAAYGRAGDGMRFYEINPDVQPIAEHLFTYLRDSKATVSVVTGDARASLAREPAQGFDVLVVDAFSGDAIPLHLLTREAMAIYRRHLAPGGVLAFHVSNQYVELEPEIGELARAAGMEARSVTSLAKEATGEFRASWVLVAEDAWWFEQEGIAGKVNHIEPRVGVGAWTDDRSSLLPLVRW